MSSQTFTPSNVVDMNKERDWAASIGMMDWDATKIVFTKRSLIEFLKYTGTTVDTNFSNISKLPKYAKFGKISAEPVAEAEDTNAIPKAESSASAPNEDSSFRPSRRVRTGPGGPSTGLFEEEFADDALSQAPPKSKSGVVTEVLPATTTTTSKVASEDAFQPTSGLRPSRRVRTAPGGKDSIAETLWNDSDDSQFKPTRRVRQGPGGEDSVGSLFG